MKKLSVTFITVFMFQLLLYPLTAFAQTLVANDFTKSTPRDTTLSFSANDFIGSANPPSGKSLVSIRFLPPEESAAIIRAHGTDRVLFGTDYPLSNHKFEFECMKKLNLTNDEYEKIYWKNAFQLLNLK